MIERVTANNLETYENFISSHRKGHFMQSSLWGKLKSSWKWEALMARDENGDIRGSIAVLIRRLPGLPYTLMYGARGPVCDLHDKATLSELIAGIKALAKEYHTYSLKLDPDISKEDTVFPGIMRELGFSTSESGKNFEGIQPRFVFRLDVENKTEEELLAFFHQKTRYNIRVAEKKGVEVKICGKEMLPDFARIMLETGVRDGFVTRPLSYFERLLDELGDHARLYMAFHEGIPISGTLAIHFGDKVWYLYGASSNEYRNLMPNYLLQWHMIRWAVAEKCRIYDFRGVSGDLSEDNPLYGLYRFKKGFNGDFVEFIGEMDYVINPTVNFAVENGTKVLRSVRRFLFLLKNREKKS